MVFAPGAAHRGASAKEPQLLAAAVLAPTTADQATVRVTETLSDRDVAVHTAWVVTFLLTVVLLWARRRSDRSIEPLPEPPDTRRPHRRGPPLLTV
jgi:hypothetical protein